jgi:hypothetical protein
MIRVAAILVCLALTACAAGTPRKSVAPGDTVTLGVGEAVPVKGTSTSLRFVGLIEDSRCPRDTTCIWAGEVKVRIEFLERSVTSRQSELKLGEGVESGGVRVTLEGVEPQPMSNARISAQGYRATFSVRPGAR